MALNPYRPDEYICGETVKVFYVYRRNLLEYSEIRRTNGDTLHGFPNDGHFVAKITKALVRTSNPVEVYKSANDCTLYFNRQPAGPIPTDAQISTINRKCEAPWEEKMQQMASNKTLPIVIEKVKAESVYAKPWYPEGFIPCVYKKHSPRFLKKDLVGTHLSFDDECNTANVVEFPAPVMLFYGKKYQYQMAFSTIAKNLLVPHPRIVIVFYGHLCETIHREFTADGAAFFSALVPRLYEGDQTESDSENEPTEYESGIDDFDDDMKKNKPKNKVPKGAAAKSNSNSEKSKDKLKDEPNPKLVRVKTTSLGPNAGTLIEVSRENAEVFYNKKK